MVDKAGANKAKNAGNIAFKAKDFDTAISSYNTAIELDPDEVIFNMFTLAKLFFVPDEATSVFIIQILNNFFNSQIIPYFF